MWNPFSFSFITVTKCCCDICATDTLQLSMTSDLSKRYTDPRTGSLVEVRRRGNTPLLHSADEYLNTDNSVHEISSRLLKFTRNVIIIAFVYNTNTDTRENF